MHPVGGTNVALRSVRMKVRLKKKYAERIDGVDLSDCKPGDVFDLPPEKARLVVAEKWAIPERREHARAPDSPQRRADDQSSL